MNYEIVKCQFVKVSLRPRQRLIGLVNLGICCTQNQGENLSHMAICRLTDTGCARLPFTDTLEIGWTEMYFFFNHRGGATSRFMLIQGTICWVSVGSRPSLTYAVNVRIFKVHVLILSMRIKTRPRFNVPSERRRK